MKRRQGNLKKANSFWKLTKMVRTHVPQGEGRTKLSYLEWCCFTRHVSPGTTRILKREGNWNWNSSCNCFWDRYWWRAEQPLANFFPGPQLKSQKSLQTSARPSFLLVSKVANWRLRLTCQYKRSKVLARRVSSRPMDAHFGRNTRKIHLIFYNFMGKHAFWTASFQCLAKSLNRITDLVYTLCWAVGCATEKGIGGPGDKLIAD